MLRRHHTPKPETQSHEQKYYAEIEKCRERLDKELAVKNGAMKLAQSANRECQYLEALKAVHVANLRTNALAADLQHAKSNLKSPTRHTPISICHGKMFISRLKIPLNWSRNRIEEAKKKQEKGKPDTRLAGFLVAKLSYRNHTRLLDTELICLSPGTSELCFSSPIVFDQVPHDFTIELTLHTLPMSDIPLQAESNAKLLTKLKKRHKVVEDILKSDSSFSSRNNFRLRNRSCSDHYLDSGEWIKFATAHLNIATAKPPCSGGQSFNLRLTKQGQMLHRFLPTLMDSRLTMIIQPECFSVPLSETFLNYYDENTYGPPIWRNMYADILSGSLRLWTDLDYRANAVKTNLQSKQSSEIIAPFLALDITHPDIKINEIESSRSRRPNSFQVRDFVNRYQFSMDTSAEMKKFLSKLKQHRKDVATWLCVTKPDDCDISGDSHGQAMKQLAQNGFLDSSRIISPGMRKRPTPKSLEEPVSKSPKSITVKSPDKPWSVMFDGNSVDRKVRIIKKDTTLENNQSDATGKKYVKPIEEILGKPMASSTMNMGKDYRPKLKVKNNRRRSKSLERITEKRPDFIPDLRKISEEESVFE